MESKQETSEFKRGKFDLPMLIPKNPVTHYQPNEDISIASLKDTHDAWISVKTLAQNSSTADSVIPVSHLRTNPTSSLLLFPAPFLAQNASTSGGLIKTEQIQQVGNSDILKVETDLLTNLDDETISGDVLQNVLEANQLKISSVYHPYLDFKTITFRKKFYFHQGTSLKCQNLGPTMQIKDKSKRRNGLPGNYLYQQANIVKSSLPGITLVRYKFGMPFGIKHCFNFDCLILKALCPVGKLGFIFWCMPFLGN